MAMNIKQIEGELQRLLQADKANWVRIYELLTTVEQDSLWKGIDRSFTAWVRSLAQRIGIHESLLWSRKKAGGIYAEYAQRAAARGEQPAAMESLNVSPDSLVFCEKIARGNVETKDELISKAVSGELKRSDLKQAWAHRRAEMEKQGIAPVKKNAHTELAPEHENNEDKAAKKNELTAADVVLALTRPSWLPTCDRAEVLERTVRQRPLFRVMTEFPVNTGTSHHARRIDLVAIENYSIIKSNDIVLHGVEVKVSKSDLLNDHKTSEYANHVDYLWFAVPEHLLDDAKTVAGAGWGIITVNEKKVASIAVPAQKLNPIMREKTLTTAVIKLL